MPRLTSSGPDETFTERQQFRVGRLPYTKPKLFQPRKSMVTIENSVKPPTPTGQFYVGGGFILLTRERGSVCDGRHYTRESRF